LFPTANLDKTVDAQKFCITLRGLTDLLQLFLSLLLARAWTSQLRRTIEKKNI